MIDQAGCIHKSKNVTESVSFQCLSKSLVCFFYIFLNVLFFFYFIWHNPSWHWLVTPVSHQGGIQTLSISHSNSCIWQVPVRHPNAFQLSVKTPPCLLFIADPHPTSSLPVPTKAAPLLQLCALSTLLLGVAFIPDALMWTPHLWIESCSVCHRCVWSSKNMCFSNGWRTHLLHVLCTSLVVFVQYLVRFLQMKSLFLYLTYGLPSFVICVAKCIQSLSNKSID